MTVVANIFRNSAANAIGIGLSALGQLISVPILATAWGGETYGVWLMLTAVPTYLALADFGFVDAGTGDMAVKAAQGERQAVVEVFSSIAAFFLAGAVIVNIAAAAMIWSAAAIGLHWAQEFGAVLHMLAFYSSLTIVSRVSLSALRANRMYAAGTLAYDSLTFFELAVTLAIVVSHGGFAMGIAGMIACRLINILLIYRLLRNRLPWLSFESTAVSMAELKRLSRPALGGMAIPVSLSILLQGTVLIVGTVVSPAAAAVFVSVRTVSRMAIQLAGIVSRATTPEIAHALAAGGQSRAGRLVLFNGALAGLVLFPAGLLFAVFGSALVDLWTRGAVQADPAFVAAMAVSMVIHGGWYLVSNMLLATNAHGMSAKIFVASAPFTALLVFAGAKLGGLFGVACAIALGEGVCLAGALWVLGATFFVPARLPLPIRMPGR